MLKREAFLDHEQDNEYCRACYGWGPQAICECGGVAHSEFEEESGDSVFLTYECDRCNSQEKSD